VQTGELVKLPADFTEDTAELLGGLVSVEYNFARIAEYNTKNCVLW
jgi:hypothetical protein